MITLRISGLLPTHNQQYHGHAAGNQRPLAFLVLGLKLTYPQEKAFFLSFLFEESLLYMCTDLPAPVFQGPVFQGPVEPFPVFQEAVQGGAGSLKPVIGYVL